MDNFLDTFLESINDEIDNYYIEKETREEYAKRQFKKRYKYDDKDKTISVNGRKIKIDMDTNKPIMRISSEPRSKGKIMEGRRTSAEVLSDEPTIHLGKEFFKLKNNKRRDAILQHEVGHTKLHSMKSSDKDLKTNKAALSYINQNINNIKSTLKAFGYDKSEIEEFINGPDIKKMKKEIVKSYLKNGMPTNKERAKLRDSAIEKFKKFDKSKEVSHANTDEFEADRYAANKSGSGEFKKGLRETYKFARKSIKNRPKEVRSAYNKIARC